MSQLKVRRFVQPVGAILLCAIVIGIPFWLALITSAKTQGDARQPDLNLPSTWNLVQNYVEAFTQGQVLSGLFWSVVIVVPSVVLVIILGSMAAWVFGRRTGGRMSVLYAIAVSGVLIPPAVVPLVLVLRNLQLEGSAVGLIAVYVGMYLSTVIFFVSGFVRTIPVELEEAARIDGAAPAKIYFSVVFPLLRPVIATAAILITLFAWNDVFYAFFVVGGGAASTLPLNLYSVASASLYLNNWNLIFAFVIMMSIPLVVVFVVGQRRIISGITSGAVK